MQLSERVADYLNQQVSSRAFTSYERLATDMGGYAPRSIHIACALGAALEQDHVEGRPHRSATVVRGKNSRGAGLPGKGYFLVCHQLGLIHDLNDRTFMKKLWASQIEELGIEVPENYLSLSFGF